MPNRRRPTNGKAARPKTPETNAKAEALEAFRETPEEQFLTTNQASGSTTTRTRSRPARGAPRSWKTSSFARRSRTSTTSAFPSAWSTRAARPRTATSRSTSRWAGTPAPSFSRTPPLKTPVFVRFSTVAGSRGSSDLARDVRGLRGEVLHGGRQLRPGRQQHPGLLHPGRGQVSRPHPRRQARTAQRDPAGGLRPRHLLGLHLA